MAVAPIQIGDICYLDYGEVPHVVHARLVLAEVDRLNSDFVILTPDHDVYTERLDGANPDLVGFYRSAANGAPPAGVLQLGWCMDLRQWQLPTWPGSWTLAELRLGRNELDVGWHQ